MFGRKLINLFLEVYKITKKFPKEELFCLTAQFRKAAVSIPANIAEGYKKRGKNDKVRFFNISEGSLEESKYYLILALDLDYIDCNDSLLEMAEEVSKLLSSYSQKILDK